MKRTSALTGLAALLAGVILVACGGGGGEEAGDGPGQRITDPALVPTSTPMQDPVLYKISNDTITTEGGASATVAPGTAATPRAGRKTYTVESGDTCSGIAAKLGVSLEDLLRANRSIDSECRNIRAGDELVVPGEAAPSPTSAGGEAAQATPTPSAGTSGRTYRVVENDTCEGIAAKVGISVSDLLAANPSVGPGCTGLQIDQELQLP